MRTGESEGRGEMGNCVWDTMYVFIIINGKFFTIKNEKTIIYLSISLSIYLSVLYHS